MKSRFLFLFVLFMGFSAYTFAQAAAEAAPVKQDAPKQEMSMDKAKSAECAHGQTAAKSDCKWVDANNDGICDTCGKKECGDKKAAKSMSGCDPAACPSKSGTMPSGCCSSKGGKK